MSLRNKILNIIDRAYDNTLIPGLPISVEVRYTQYLNAPYDPTSESRDDVPATSFLTTGLLRPITRNEVNNSDGLLLFTDSVLTVRRSGTDFNEGILSPRDKIEVKENEGGAFAFVEYRLIEFRAKRVGSIVSTIRLVIRKVDSTP